VWDLIELLSGERHLVPWDQQIPRHEHSRDCWCNPFHEDGMWIHLDPSSKSNRKPAGSFLLAGGAGIPGAD
jgi:hypothetical protein